MDIDGVNVLTAHKVGISNHKGVLGMLKRKVEKFKQWPDEHGEIYNVDNAYFNARTISLEGFVYGDSLTEFNDNLSQFQRIMEQPGLRCFEFYGVEQAFFCYSKEGATASPVNRLRDGRNAARFQLKLYEPEPYMPVVKVSASATASLVIALTGKCRIYWGDGQYSNVTAGATYSHSYDSSGYYWIGITGNIGSITTIETSSGTFTGDLGLLLRGLDSLYILDAPSENFTAFNGGLIPRTLGMMNLASNNISQGGIDRLLKSLWWDGRNHASDRIGGMNVYMQGNTAPSSVGSTFKSKVDPHIGTLQTD